ncbi:MAG: hypothetical protein QG621_351 [Patescibacteria group bacterium]|jgi:hypothetical protein|nr:hypothetical protein [Patescibacteria group bacterium]
MEQEKQNDISPQENNLVQPLQTFQTDIEKVLQSKELSKKDLAAAEALRGKKGELAAPLIQMSTKAPTAPPPPQTPPAPVEPKSVVLPQKEVHSPLNAMRASADKLVAQEEQATLPKVKAPPMPTPKPQSAVPPIQTFNTDVGEYVKDNKVSAVQVMAAEATRRAEEEKPIVVKSGTSTGVKVVLVCVGLLLLVGAGGALAYTYYTQRTLPAAENPSAPFIAVDEVVPLTILPNESSADILQSLTTTKNTVQLSLGLIAQLAITTGTTSIAAQPFFAATTPRMPASLLRTLGTQYLIGVHSYDVNQPFILLSVDSYEQGYAGMLAWEKTMQQDLAPLFNYAPVNANSSQTQTAPQILSSSFADSIVHNHDTRVVTNSAGSIVFLWTFVNRSTILITTNPGTIDEVLSRQKTAPILTLPQ